MHMREFNLDILVQDIKKKQPPKRILPSDGLSVHLLGYQPFGNAANMLIGLDELIHMQLLPINQRMLPHGLSVPAVGHPETL